MSRLNFEVEKPTSVPLIALVITITPLPLIYHVRTFYVVRYTSPLATQSLHPFFICVYSVCPCLHHIVVDLHAISLDTTDLSNGLLVSKRLSCVDFAVSMEQWEGTPAAR